MNFYPKTLILMLVMMFMNSCSTRTALFEVNTQLDVSIQLGLSIITTHNFVFGDVSVPIDLNIQTTGLNKDDIAEILPFEAFLKPRFGDNINLDFINSANIYIIDPVTLRRKEIFYLDFINLGQKTEIELIPTLIDITDLVINDRAIVEVSLELRQFPPSSFDLRCQLQFAGFASE